MTKINIIVAMCKNRGIGYENKISWGFIKQDMINFKKLTIGNGNNAVIMGKNTFLSLPKGTLINRDNLVLSTSLNDNDIIKLKNKCSLNNLYFFKSIIDIDNYIKEKEYDEIWIIGGEQIYNLYINKADEIYITYIDKEYKCDTFFPNIVEQSFISKTLKNNYDINGDKDVKIYKVYYKS